MELRIYAGDDYKLIDLFKDETINLTVKLNDIESLSSVFTDFSNSFTIPATDNNNEIFKHYYDHSIDNGFNANFTIPAYMELWGTPFKFGKLRLEGVNIKNNTPTDYKVTFFDKTTSLTELFGDDTIDRLDYVKVDGVEILTFNNLEKHYIDNNNLGLSNGVNGDWMETLNDYGQLFRNVFLPLISYTDRDWNYGTSNSLDISTDAGAITGDELRPALRLSVLLDGIKDKYNLDFSGNFFTSEEFKNLFIWCNQKEDTSNPWVELQLTNPLIGTNDGKGAIVGNYGAITHKKSNSVPGDRYYAIWRFEIDPDTDASNFKYNARIKDDNGNVVKEINNVQGNQTILHQINIPFSYQPEELITSKYKLEILDINGLNSFLVNLRLVYTNLLVTTFVDATSSNNNMSASTPQITMEDNLPKMKVSDFIQGLMKAFKLVIRPTGTNSFYVDNISKYLSLGDTHDITEYVDIDEINVARPTLYQKINLKYQKTNNVAGKKFRQLFDPISDDLGYGDLKFEYKGLDGTDSLKVELPFENMMFERLIDVSSQQKPTNINIGQSVSLGDDGSTISKNKSKPILFYYNGLSKLDYPIVLKWSSFYLPITQIPVIGSSNNIFLDQVTNSLNFNAEIDSWHGVEIENSLYKGYWEQWINDIYNIKQRKISLKANLPLSIITKLSINDSVIIGSSKYKINDYKVNLITGLTNLTLYNEFTDITPKPVIENDNIDLTPSFHYFDIKINTSESWTISNSNPEITIYNGLSGVGDHVVNCGIEYNSAPVNLNFTINITVDGVVYPVTINQGRSIS